MGIFENDARLNRRVARDDVVDRLGERFDGNRLAAAQFQPFGGVAPVDENLAGTDSLADEGAGGAGEGDKQGGVQSNAALFDREFLIDNHS
jgi:hypothetical protein